MKKYSTPTLKISNVSAEDIIITSDPTIQNGSADNSPVLMNERDRDWSNWEN